MVTAKGAQQRIKHTKTITNVLVIFAFSAKIRSEVVDLVQEGSGTKFLTRMFLMAANCFLCFLVNDNIWK